MADWNGSVPAHSGCSGARARARSIAKKSWKYAGCSDQSVPSLSKVAIRSSGAMKSGLAGSVTDDTKFSIASRVGPAFHDGSAGASTAAPPPDADEDSGASGAMQALRPARSRRTGTPGDVVDMAFAQLMNCRFTPVKIWNAG